ncbi:hypothetical protein [Companilactobacillus bobalius]|uniref:DUF2513 domain-containing protein n=2 Tax=Companilactobacillus bobalius TaxID=2801451 RepID=A0A202F6R7_9LACO|nr:hypothetical protein [Companilactobacillus bobalius]KAE9558501.1 hypothetical protein ATN92_14045 [Companilactobacillus bobalius]KRK83782.1 hypothetical protein FC78_GL001366 [Companilactobacillus bobalius DSM 19674]OVE96118.1 hypothetical protein LKACC16343_02415 [Companilactobacillus bobalius]GEO58202.1 hypothetical protein LBO01_13310 [Companilactobacillus paralimentarius]
MNYFDMYKMILEIIAEQNPKDFQELLDDSQKYPLIKGYIASDNNNQILIRDMQDTTISMINDGLISGIISPLKYVTLIKLNGLTISGFQYLKRLKNDLNKNEINTLLKQSDLPLTPSNLTKMISKIIFS